MSSLKVFCWGDSVALEEGTTGRSQQVFRLPARAGREQRREPRPSTSQTTGLCGFIRVGGHGSPPENDGLSPEGWGGGVAAPSEGVQVSWGLFYK